MKKYIRTLSLLLTAVLTISLTGCGSSDADGGKDRKGLMAAKELSGVWTDESGNILRLDTVENTYTYRTRYGRIGSGVLTAAEDGENAPQLEFGDFLYDFEVSDGGFTLRSQGSGGGESLDGARFTPGGEIPEIPLEKLNGMWQNCEGETLVIDTSRMQYIACSKEAMSSGTVVDKQDGKADEYADIDKKDFVSQDGHMWYFDGVQYYALPEGYTVKDDGFAYDENGSMFAAGKKTAPYNPADDWGEGWAENWEEKK